MIKARKRAWARCRSENKGTPQRSRYFLGLSVNVEIGMNSDFVRN